MSVGVPGVRVGTGPRGNHVRLGGGTVAASGGTWHVEASAGVWDRKYHAGASQLVRRSATAIRTAPPSARRPTRRWSTTRGATWIATAVPLRT